MIIQPGLQETYRSLVCGEWSFCKSARNYAKNILLVKTQPASIVFNIINAYIDAFDYELKRMNELIIPIWNDLKQNWNTKLSLKYITSKLYPYLFYSEYKREFLLFLQNHSCNFSYNGPLRTKNYI